MNSAEALVLAQLLSQLLPFGIGIYNQIREANADANLKPIEDILKLADANYQAIIDAAKAQEAQAQADGVSQ